MCVYVYCAILQVPAEPDSRKMSPAQFSDNMVPPVKQITNLHRVVATWNTNRTKQTVENIAGDHVDITEETQALGGCPRVGKLRAEEREGHLYDTEGL